MHSSISDEAIETRASPLLALIERQQALCDAPCFVALDGGSGSGKSTLAAYVANTTPSVTVIEGDEFYSGGSLNLWSSRSASENAQYCIDWRKQHRAISTLQSTGFAQWYAFDWRSEHWDSDSVPHRVCASTCSATPVVLLEGVYSARPELTALFNLRVLLDVPRQVRQAQLHARESGNPRADWDHLWSEAEQYYMSRQLDHRSINLVLT